MTTTTYLLKQMPFVRLVVSLIIGIILQWYLQFSLTSIGIFTVVLSAVLLVFAFLKFSAKYSFRWLQGLALELVFVAIGILITYNKDIRHNNDWLGYAYKDSIPVIATLQEPLVEKARSYKAQATVEAIQVNGQWQHVTGDVLLYFNKENVAPALRYGSQVVFMKTLQPIKNSGNPGSFNYERYNAFQDIYHQVFLKQDEYITSATTHISPFKQWLINARLWVIHTLRKHISGDKESGVAEALLIGYRDDLDKDLVQAYSNTGVVHIVAISGLHLGMIYGVLAWLFKFFRNKKWVKFVKPVVILIVLWIFTFIAGGVPSIARSAVMFTFIVLAEAIGRKTSIYNTLAASAFVMLCYNPFFLWDVGFQLSYAAVISIVTFMKPIHNWFYVKNKTLNILWELVAVTLSAQILTIPIIFFYFHQFPNLFLITNFVVVPLSSIILFAELAVLVFAHVMYVSGFLDDVTTVLLRFMNNFIERFNQLPFAVTTGIQNSVVETILLYGFIIAVCYWLYHKWKPSLYISLSIGLLFLAVKSYDEMQHQQQAKLVVYNIPKYEAFDFIEGKQYLFKGDTALMQDGFLKNFHIQPCRTLYQVYAASELYNLQTAYPFIQFRNKRIVLVDNNFSFTSPSKIPVDIIILSKNARVYISKLADVFDCPLYVFDGSNSLWKINRWKKDCDNLHLPHYSTPDKGAYQLEL